MMKKFFIVLSVIALLSVYAGIPQSISIVSGNIRIRLDGRKFWNMNRIEWKNELFGVDEKGAHYGIAYQPQGGRFFIGSGHDESGKTEELVSLEIFADGKKQTATENVVIQGKKIRIDRVSKITGLLVRTQTVIADDIIYERAEISAEKPVKISYLYFFMHPWSTRFDKFHAVRSDGTKLDLTFKSDNKFPNRQFVPAAAWYDTKSGLGVATIIRNVSGKKAPRRFLWDRRNYRKDYLCDYSHATFMPGKVVIYEAKTGFFRTATPENWIRDAEALFANMK